MSDTESALLRVLEQNPADDDARAVLADWLEEQGRANDAELVRVFLARKAMHAGAAEVGACSRRLHELTSSSSWSGRRAVLCEHSLRATVQGFVDPPWTSFDPLRLGQVPSGHGTPDLFVRVESDAGPVLRIDVYSGHGYRVGGAASLPGLVLIGYGRRLACVEPYGRSFSEIHLGADFEGFHQTPSLILVTSAERVLRLGRDGSLLWRSEPVGASVVRVSASTVEAEGYVEGEGDFEDWETGDIETRAFRLDLATGALL